MTRSIAQADERGNWKSPAACEVADAVWSIERSYRLVCGMAASERSGPICGRRLQCPDDRREEQRHLICLPVSLTPVLPAGEVLNVVAAPIAAVTRDLSGHGVGLRHDHALPTPFTIAEFDVFGEPVRLLIEICWTRAEGDLSSLSGGRFVAVIDPRRMVGCPPATDCPAVG